VFILALTSGTRAAVLSSVLSFIFIYYNINANNKHKANFLKLSIGGLFLLISAIYLGDLREGQYNLIVSLSEASDKILYGNNFSDLRDFSWVLSCWNGVNLYGKSILAGLLAFIPSSNFPFRADWSFGIFTAKLIGYDPTIFPGLRTGLFGEYYINFGLIGVCFAGFFYGFTIGSINHFVQDTINNSKKPNEVVYKVSLGYVISYLVYNFFNTAGFFSVYVTLLFLSIGYIRVLFRKRERSKKKVGTMRRI
jgi:oligosaccharide repeat unit polymerase